jgi:glycosyltransferase involved in cell wall biosynthesis
MMSDERFDDVRLVPHHAHANDPHVCDRSARVRREVGTRMPLPRRLNVLIACPGVGRERRGFETFAEECFRALRDDDRLNLMLAKGAGRTAADEFVVRSVARRSRAARAVGRPLGRGGLWAEQATFAAGLTPKLLRLRPDVVLLSEWELGSWLWRWRRATRSAFRVVLSNGAPYSPPFATFDHVQQLTEAHRAAAMAAGEPAYKHSVVPYGFFVPSRIEPQRERNELRRKLQLPQGRPIVISVGSLDFHHKRHDDVLRAIAATRTAPFLLLLGERGPETPAVEALARSLLLGGSYAIRTVEPREIRSYYAASDVFVLAARREGFGRVLVEACGAGLPCIVNDFAVAREVLGPWGIYEDTADPGRIAARIDEALEQDPRGSPLPERRRQAMHERYDWSSLRDRYVALFERAARTPLQATNGRG